jgi:pimeloyl-ACP methyl ester carboxylesterase
VNRPRAGTLAFEDHGGENDGPPIAFLHGAGGSRLHWPPTLRRRPRFRTLAPDLPGHGESPDVGAASIGDYAGEVAAWLDALGTGQVFLVGHSMGSATALTIALETPARIAGLVLVGSGPRLQVNQAILEGLADPDRQTETIERILKWSFGREAPARLVELARRRMFETDPGVLLRDFQACHGFDVGARLMEIVAPTLVVTGEDDRMTPPSLGDALRAGIPGARRVLIPAAGHMAMLEATDRLAAELDRFLVDAGRASPS